MSVRDDLLETGFQLAWFIIPDRMTAVRILIGAVNKLEAQCQREKKRRYWRDKYLKRRITRVSKDERDTLQWLIYVESDHYEKLEEQAAKATVEDMVVRYVKSLVRHTTGMSSFYVNIGLRRILYHYTTSEVQQLYEALTEYYLESDVYRRAKAQIMNQALARFGEFVRIVDGEPGGVRFQALDDQRNWTGRVAECLKTFTPWSTLHNCPIPVGTGSLASTLRCLSSRNADEKIDPNAVEIQRCHAFIEPDCFSRLAAQLALDAPDLRLAVPRFYMKNDETDTHQNGRWQHTPSLTDTEHHEIAMSVASEASRRRRACPELLRVLIDGTECAKISLSHNHQINFTIQEGSKLIEIRTEDESGDLLLGTHFIRYQGPTGIERSSATLRLKGRGDFELTVTPTAEAHSCSAVVALVFRQSGFRAGVKKSLERIPVLRLTVAAATLVAFIVAIRLLRSASFKIADYTFATWIAFSLGLLLMFLWAGLIQLRRRSQKLEFGDIMPLLAPVDVEVLREAMNPKEEYQLRQSTSKKEFRELQRKRDRLASKLLRQMAHNAALLQQLGYGQLRNQDQQLAAEAQELIDAGTYVRLYAFLGLGLIFFRRVSGLRSASFGPIFKLRKLTSLSVIPAYESLRAKANGLTILRESVFREALARNL